MTTDKAAALPAMTPAHVCALENADFDNIVDRSRLHAEILSVVSSLERGQAVVVPARILEQISDLAVSGSVDKYPTNALHAISRLVNPLIPEYIEARRNESREALRAEYGDDFVNAVDQSADISEEEGTRDG